MLIRKFPDIPFCPYIPTEETIFKNMDIERDLISDDYELICLPLAHSINTIGTQKTNTIISTIHSHKIRVFVCQHIYVNKLIFDESDIIFTPHSGISDKFITIPHYAVNIDEKFIREKKEKKFSFLGSTSTHWTRKKLVELYENCNDSGKHWGLETDDQNFKETYIKELGTSEFSLCPRGTGISSVRLFESMAMGSFPVIISDGYEPPLKHIIDWTRLSFKVNEKDINSIPLLLDSIVLDVNFLTEMYEKYLSNHNLHRTLTVTLL